VENGREKCSSLQLLLFVVMLIVPTQSCGIAGYDSGECVDENFFDVQLDFCGEFITYRACMPIENTAVYPNHTISKKDAWVQTMYEQIVEERVEVETDDDLLAAQLNEFGDPGIIMPRFTDEDRFPNCLTSFKAYMCYINFPRCDEQDKSLIMCKSTCQNLMDTCGISYDLQRCGPPEYHNGNEPEEMLFWNDAGSYPMLMRDFYPGQPFRENEYEDEQQKFPKLVCTPSIYGSSSMAKPSIIVMTATMALVYAYQMV
jgi:hypothetical protein